MNRYLRFAGVCVVTGALAACADAGSPDALGRSVDVSNIEQLSVALVARIGSLNDVDQALTRPGSIAIGPDDEVFISQPEDGNVRVYDTHGTFVRTIGRRGEGPGEFERPAFIGFSGDTLYVTDNGIGRLTFFARDGRFLRSRQWHTTLRSDRSSTGVMIMFDATVPQILLTDGTGLVEVNGFMAYRADPSSDEPIRSLGTLPQPFLHVDDNGQPIDTVSQQLKEKIQFGVTASGATWYYETPFADAPLATLMLDGSGIVVVDRRVAADDNRATFNVTLLGLGRDTVFSQSLAYQPLPVAAGVVRRTAERMDAAREKGPEAAAIEASLRGGARSLIPSTLPPVSALTVGQDASIWLRREAVAADSTEWIALDGAGEPIGAVLLPAGDSIVAAKDGRLATIHYDELDVPYVTTYRIRNKNQGFIDR